MKTITYFRAYVRCRNILSDVDIKHRIKYGQGYAFATGFARRRWKRYARLARKLEARLEAMLGEKMPVVLMLYRTAESRKADYEKIAEIEKSIKGTLHGADCNVVKLATDMLRGMGWKFEDESPLHVAEMLLRAYCSERKKVIGMDQMIADMAHGGAQ